MSSPKPMQIILARQPASCLSRPILIVDTKETLIFYTDLQLDRLMAEAIDDVKPAFQVAPGLEGMAFEL